MPWQRRAWPSQFSGMTFLPVSWPSSLYYFSSSASIGWQRIGWTLWVLMDGLKHLGRGGGGVLIPRKESVWSFALLTHSLRWRGVLIYLGSSTSGCCVSMSDSPLTMNSVAVGLLLLWATSVICETRYFWSRLCRPSFMQICQAAPGIRCTAV